MKRELKAWARRQWRRIGPAPRGFHTRYAHVASAARPVARYDEIARIFARHDASVIAVLDEIARHEALFIASATDGDALEWVQHWIPPLDGAAIYAILASRRPAQVIEVGSGVSTHFMARAIRDLGLATRITCIDPMPRRSIEALGVGFEPRILSAADAVLTDRLGENDILFIDSSHLLQPGFDLDIVLNRLMPRLAPGVIVHFHDIFLPYDYPENWERRRYNEQNALPALLMGGGYDLLFSSNYAARDMEDRYRALCPGFPLMQSKAGGSLWLIKRGPSYR
ncbi:MAG: class I SAM-dependent methyltransferase [Paracoccaceae bacterium]